MTVKELREILVQYPDDMEVVTSMMSCYEAVKPPRLRKMFRHQSIEGLYEDYYPAQWERAKRPPTFNVLYFEGN